MGAILVSPLVRIVPVPGHKLLNCGEIGGPGLDDGEKLLFNRLEFALGTGQLAGDAGIALAGGVSGAGKGFEQGLDDVVRLVAVE